jgi:hypothetical protein
VQRGQLLRVEVGNRAEVLGRVHDDLVPGKGGVEVRHDADLPVAPRRQAEHLGRGAVLTTAAERARLELVRGGRRLEMGERAGPLATRRRGDDQATRQRVTLRLR